MEVFQWQPCQAQAKPLAISCGSDRDVFNVNKNIMDSFYKSCTFWVSQNYTDYLKLTINLCFLGQRPSDQVFTGENFAFLLEP